jgi:HlyD family secretion protein
VVVEPAARGLIVQTITAPGQVEPVEEAEIASQVVGRVVAVPVKEGDAVKKGDLLVKLDETDARARLDSALARWSGSARRSRRRRPTWRRPGRDATRSQRLVARGASSATEVADARSLLAKAMAATGMSRNELAESEAMRRTSQQDLERTEIRAPIDGVVAGLTVEVGEVVIAGTTNLPGTVMMSVCDLGRMRVRADVDETDVPLVRPGSRPASTCRPTRSCRSPAPSTASRRRARRRPRRGRRPPRSSASRPWCRSTAARRRPCARG